MNKFVKVKIYCKCSGATFDEIKKSTKPEILINTDEIVSIGPKDDWGFFPGYLNYPFKKLTLHNNDSYYLPLKEADELEKQLLNKY